MTSDNAFRSNTTIYEYGIPVSEHLEKKKKFKLFFSSFPTPSVHLIRDHLWDCTKVVLKTTFEQSQRWS